MTIEHLIKKLQYYRGLYGNKDIKIILDNRELEFVAVIFKPETSDYRLKLTENFEG